MGPKDWTQVVRLGRGDLNPMSHPPCLSFHVIFLTQGLSLSLELTILSRPAGQPAPGILPSLPPKCWDYGCHTWISAWVLAVEPRDTCLWHKHFTNWKPPQPLFRPYLSTIQRHPTVNFLVRKVFRCRAWTFFIPVSSRRCVLSLALSY